MRHSLPRDESTSDAGGPCATFTSPDANHRRAAGRQHRFAPRRTPARPTPAPSRRAPRRCARPRVIAPLQCLARRLPRPDAKQRFQDAQHAIHRCWRCRRPGRRRPAHAHRDRAIRVAASRPPATREAVYRASICIPVFAIEYTRVCTRIYIPRISSCIIAVISLTDRSR